MPHPTPRLPRRTLLGLGLAGLLAPALVACQPGADGGPVASVAGNPQLVLDSIEGAPAGIVPKLSPALAAEAQRRGMTLVPASKAGRYRLKGYLTAGPGPDGGTELAWVWDLFEGDRRARRVEGSDVTRAAPGRPSPGEDAWAEVDDAALARVAARSMNEVAAFLAGG